MTRYVGILDHSDGAWGVRIPDLPGCYGAGGSHEEAMADAAEAVREWIAHQSGRGVAIPSARSADAVLADPLSEFDASAEAAVLVELTSGNTRNVTAGAPIGAK